MQNTLDEVLQVTKAMSDEGRVKVLLWLREGEQCVCDITEHLGLAASTTSKHMSVLKSAKLVISRKEGRWIHYRLNDELPLAVNSLNWLFRELGLEK